MLIVAEDGYAVEARHALTEIGSKKLGEMEIGNHRVVDSLDEAQKHIGDADILVCGYSTHSDVTRTSTVGTHSLIARLKPGSRASLVARSLGHKDHPIWQGHTRATYVKGDLRDITTPDKARELLRTCLRGGVPYRLADVKSISANEQVEGHRKRAYPVNKHRKRA
jgi:hypothetical protein